jgi:uracil-DNA glycosylase
LVPTYHPAAALRGSGEIVAEMRADFVRAKRLLAGAVP